MLSLLFMKKTKHPVHIIVFAVVTSNGDIMPPFVFLHGFKLNTEAYIKSMEEIVLFWIERVAAGRFCVWPHNLCWLWESFCDYITPKIKLINSPDCNPVYYYEWGTGEWEINKIISNTKDELRARITAAFTRLNKETVRKACGRFVSCLEAVVEANGNFYE